VDWWELDPRTEYQREYRRKYRADRKVEVPAKPRKNAKQAKPEKPFVGVDGEGGQLIVDGVERHCYWLLRIGDQVLRPSEARPYLTTRECLDFICQQSPEAIYVGFYLGYDFTKILQGLPEERLRRLMQPELRRAKLKNVLLPLDWGPFQIDMLASKELRVRKLKQERVGAFEFEGIGRGDYGPWITLNDVGPFFQCSFLKAIKLWQIGTEQEQALIQEGKSKRADFGEGTEEIEVYNALEVALLENLMTKFRDSCGVAGVLPRKWQGPGQLAEAAFRKYKFPLSKDLELLGGHPDLMTFANNSFYGGRPEFMAFGPVEREVFQYDINSAYPAAMMYVPCLEHGVWRNVKERADYSWERRDGYSLCYGSFEAVEPTLWCGLPMRDKNGSISYPKAGGGWYWNFEIEASIHQRFVCEDAWVYERKCDCQPMEWVEDLYWERKRMGKNGPGLVVKLLLNSLYGKCCQSVGSPRYANPIYASFITSFCRTMLQGFIHDSPSCTDDHRCGIDILGVATDSVMTWRKREDIPVSDRLGEWSEERHPDGMFLVQPGVYFGGSGKGPKTRGFNQAAVLGRRAEFEAAFQRVVETRELGEGRVVVPQRQFVGIRSGLHRNRPDLIGEWVDYSEGNTGGKVLHFDWTTKRQLQPAMWPMPGHSYIATVPKEGNPQIVTVPYSRDIGGIVGATMERQMWEAMPDDSWRLFD
jgi:hypothetical protein